MVTNVKTDRIKAKNLFAVVFLTISLVFSSTSMAQTNKEQTGGSFGPRKQLATIVFAGLGGAVLGLSTLSFYGRPQDYLSNIAIGFAVGVISGTVFVTYKAATNTDTFSDPKSTSYFPELENSQKRNLLSSTPVANLTWTF